MVPLISSLDSGDILMRCSDILIKQLKQSLQLGKCVGWSINEDAPECTGSKRRVILGG